MPYQPPCPAGLPCAACREIPRRKRERFDGVYPDRPKNVQCHAFTRTGEWCRGKALARNEMCQNHQHERLYIPWPKVEWDPADAVQHLPALDDEEPSGRGARRQCRRD